MTIPATTRKAGPLLGNGATTTFPFAFKVFAASDIKVTIANNLGTETVRVLNQHYTVALNGNQETSPGGTVTYPISGSPLPVGSTLTIIGNLPNTQPLDLPSGGNFSPLALENQLDRATIQIQQLAERLDRTLTAPVSSTASSMLPMPEASSLIAWNENGTALENYPLPDLATALAFATFRYDTFTGDAVTTQYTLTADPITLGNLDVAVGGVTQTPGTDYTLSNGVLEFTTAPPNGAVILARFGEGVVSGPAMDSYDVRFQPAGTGAVQRTAESKLREFVSMADFGPVGVSYANDTAVLQAAINAANGATVYLPATTIYLSLNMTLSAVDSVHLVGVPGKTIIKSTYNAAGMQFRATYSDEYTVSAVSTVTLGSADGTDDSITRLTITGGVSAFAENQICKIYSSDLSYYAAADSKNCSGELFEVRAIDSGNSYVYVKGLLKCTYTTSIKVRILDKKKVTIEKVEFDIDESVYGVYDDVNIVSRNYPSLKFWGIHEPTLRQVTFRKSWAQCCNLVACWMPDIEARFDFIINGTDNNWGPGYDALGYGVTTMCCFGGHIKVMAEGCRHVFTTLHPEESAFVPSRWLEVGETIGTKISGTAVNSNGSPFDTHESGIGLIFENCYVIEPRRGPTGSVRGKGFSNRARGTKYLNCHQIGGFQGFLNLDVDHGAEHTIEYLNCTVRDLYGTSSAAFYMEGSTNAPTVNMIGCSVRNSYRLIDVEAGECKVVGGIWDVKGDWFGKVRAGATLDVHGCLVDYSHHTGTDQFIRMVGASTAIVTAVRIKDSTKCTGLFYGEDSTGTKTCRIGSVESDNGNLKVTAAGSGTLTITSNEQTTLSVDIADGSADTTYYVVCPQGGRVTKIWTVLHGAVSTADIVITPSIGVVPITGGVVTISQSGSAAGVVDSATPTAANLATPGQVIALAVTGGGAGGTPRISVAISVTKEYI